MDRAGKFMNATGSEGRTVRGTERLVRASWCAYTASVDDQPVTVAMFDHPDNTRPATWFTMTAPFAYLSATLNLNEQPLVVTQDDPLHVRYGLALWDGEKEPAEIERASTAWRALDDGIFNSGEAP
jgi:hypothetical protein